MGFIEKQLPFWARRDYPVLRYELTRNRSSNRAHKWLRAFSQVMLLLFFTIVAVAAYYLQTNFLAVPIAQTVTEAAMAILFWPSFAMLLIMSLGALLITTNALSELVTNQTWTAIKATASGVDHVLRSRWLMVFSRLRWLLAAVIALRVVLIVGMLYDLTTFQGHYLLLLINGTVPEVPLLLAIILVTLLMTASLLLPFTSLAMDGAVGIYLSTFFRHPVTLMLFQLILVFLRIAYVIVLYVLAQGIWADTLNASSGASWAILFGFAGIGDWGVSLLQLSGLGNLLVLVPYGLFLGLALVIFALFQAVLADWILERAIKRAQRLEE